MHNHSRVIGLVVAACIVRVATASAQATLEIQDYLVMPVTGALDGQGSNDVLLSRVNTLREEVGGAQRLFISDLNGPLYILDKATKKLTIYLDFNGTEGKTGLFRKLTIAQGYGNGLNGFYLDPDFTRNGKFYTVHMEDPAMPGSNLPNPSSFPGLNVSGYTTTQAIRTPGPLQNEGVLVEWTDSNPANATFEGTARELLRVQLNTRSHPMGDLIFNPTARRGDPDWRVLYLECGDGASGESEMVAIRSNPQRLDNLVGKILRIIPDLNEHVATSTVSENGRYRIPNDNPFVATPGARKEIWAYGFRNPHRLNWAVDPANPAKQPADRQLGRTPHLGDGLPRSQGRQLRLRAARRQPAAEAGQHHRTAPAGRQDSDANWRSGERSPARSHLSGDSVRARCERRRLDRQRLRVQRERCSGAARQVHLHRPHDGTHLVRGLRGHAGGRRRQARHDGADARGQSPLGRSERCAGRRQEGLRLDVPDRRRAYHARGGKSARAAARRADLVFGGRADVRLSIDASGELYLYSKTDGVIRKVVGATGF
jgi:hypothetical protein